MTIYEIAELLTGFIESAMMFMLYETFCSRRDEIPKWVYGAGVIVLTLIINISNCIFNTNFFNILCMMIACFAVSFLYKGLFPIRIIISVLSYLLMGIIELFVLYGITLIYGVSVSDVINSDSLKLLGIIVSKFLSFFSISIVHTKFKRNSAKFGMLYWVILIMMYVFITATVFLLFKLSYNIEKNYLFNISIFCSFGLFFVTVLAMYFYEYLAKQTEIIKNQEHYEMYLKTQLKHLDDILIAQKQIKKFKHDFNNYTIGLKAYIKEGDYRQAVAYVNELENKFNRGKGAIETGNTALDAILSTKIAIAESKGIIVDTKIQIPEDLSINPIDICIIFGNALDNSIEACERAKATDKRIKITIVCKDKAILCKIVNTAPKNEPITLGTSKKNKQNHGFGLENIKTALAKYNANPTIERTETEFTLKFVIFINE